MAKSFSVEQVINIIPGYITHYGNNSKHVINRAATLEEADTNSITWINSSRKDANDMAKKTNAGVVICDNNLTISEIDIKNKKQCFIIVDNPKLACIAIVNKMYPERNTGISNGAVISEKAIIGKNVSIGMGCYIRDCIIRDNVKIGFNCIVNDGVEIKSNTIIHDNIVIGGSGFNYVADEKEKYHSFPHIGITVIEEDVEVNSFSHICRGVLGETRISNGVKIAQYCYIGANVFIGEDTQIRARATILGSCRIGEEVVVAPTVTIRDAVNIGNRVTVGMGSVVIKDIPPNEIWFGIPAQKQGQKR